MCSKPFLPSRPNDYESNSASVSLSNVEVTNSETSRTSLGPLSPPFTGGHARRREWRGGKVFEQTESIEIRHSPASYSSHPLLPSICDFQLDDWKLCLLLTRLPKLRVRLTRYREGLFTLCFNFISVTRPLQYGHGPARGRRQCTCDESDSLQDHSRLSVDSPVCSAAATETTGRLATYGVRHSA